MLVNRILPQALKHRDHGGQSRRLVTAGHDQQHHHDGGHNHEHGHDHDHIQGHDHNHEHGHDHDQANYRAAGFIDQSEPSSPVIPDQVESVTVMAAIYDVNDRIARQTNQLLQSAGLLTLNVMGAPGAGKTSSIIAMIRELPDWQHYVLEGDIESDLDTQTLRKLGVATLQINTHGACHLDATLVARSVADFNLAGPGLLLIENIGNLVCPAEFMIGEHCKVLVVTVTDGSDKPYKYPLAFEKADLILLNKTDLLPYVDFDEAFFMAGVRALNPAVPVLPIDARRGAGFAAVADWLRQRLASTLPLHEPVTDQ